MLGYDPVPLYSGDDELSFEEVRARTWCPKPLPQFSSKTPSGEQASDRGGLSEPVEDYVTPMDASIQASRQQQPIRSSVTASNNTSSTASTTATNSTTTTTTTTMSAGKKAEHIHTAPSPTITTKQALQDVYSMFGKSWAQ